MDPVFILLTTYNRRELALRTVQSAITYLKYPDIRWLLYDDGSPNTYMHEIRQMVEEQSTFADALNGERRGVGYGMNWGINRTRELGGSQIMILEDDWELNRPYDINPHVKLLNDNAHLGMIRMGYMSPGLKGKVVQGEGKLWLVFDHNPTFQYNYAGHPSLRHLRLHERVGMFDYGLAPGLNELSFCSKFNQVADAPAILWDLAYGDQGAFVHIGSESLADIKPEK